MRVVFLQDDFPPESFGGGGISTYELAKGIQKAGHDVCVITTCRSAHEAGESTREGLKVFKIASDYKARWRAWVSVYNRKVIREVDTLLARLQPDIVHANNIHQHLSYHSLKVAKRHAKVVVLTLRDVMSFSWGKLATRRYLEQGDVRVTWRDNLAEAGKRYNPFLRIFIKRYFRYADKIFAVSDALKRAAERNGVTNIEVMHTGIDVTPWETAEEGVEEFRKHHGLLGKKVIFFGGRLSKAKGGERMIEALERIAREVPSAVLLVASALDEYAAVIKKKAEMRGVANYLIFTGWIFGDELKAAYSASDVVCVPSLCLDAFPRVVLEGMASKRAVVATRYGGAKEAVIDGTTGHIVDPLYPEVLAGKTIDLLKNPQKAAAFGKAGYERIKAVFNLEDKVRDLVGAYHMLLEKNSN